MSQRQQGTKPRLPNTIMHRRTHHGKTGLMGQTGYSHRLELRVGLENKVHQDPDGTGLTKLVLLKLGP